MEINPIDISKQIQFYRIASGLSGQAFSDRIGITSSFYRSIETGASVPSLATLERISNALGVNINLLLCRVSKEAQIYTLDFMMRESKRTLSPAAFQLIEVVYKTVLKQLSG